MRMRNHLDEGIHDDDSQNKASRIAIRVNGIVQGVGFRPFVHELASRMGLSGWVRNESGSVAIEAEGSASMLAEFVSRVRRDAPPLARVESIAVVDAIPVKDAGFRIVPSAPDGGEQIFISPDVATCRDCLSELFDRSDRRYRYPFLNCVNCGPRFTIIEAMPYDRVRTTMKRFELCGDCRSEYANPGNRRYHAQPVACPRCGPAIKMLDAGGCLIQAQDPIKSTADALRSGAIAAIKSLGGYHLACDARSSRAVRSLRRRKKRDEKPLAIMVAGPLAAYWLCEISGDEREALLSPKRPIVLLMKKSEADIAPEVSLRSPHLGVMLPYTPLHHLLLREMKGVPLVMTSANRTDEPIAYEDDDAISRLRSIADLFLTHDRPIRIRCDDSVVRVPTPIRRSRGYAPEPIPLPFSPRAPILALGGQLKNTFALSAGRNAILSHHIGDLDDLSAFRAYEFEIPHYESLFGVRPSVLAHDLHPDYASTRYAAERARRNGHRLLAVQHHHAHMASCMAENGLNERVIGITFDGTGFGTDGHIWGGEFLVGDYRDFERVAHLRYLPMPGGDRAIREPWRMAVSNLLEAGLDPVGDYGRDPPRVADHIARMIERRINCPLTSSMGRLFDAVAALIGIRERVSYEGQAAMELEWLALKAPQDGAYSFDLVDSGIIDPSPVIRALVSDRRRGASGPEIARRFHSALVDLIERVCETIRIEHGLNTAVLSGGVFMNSLLLRESLARLREGGFSVFHHRLVPPSDGGLSLGQLAVAAAQIERESDHVSRHSRKSDRDLPRARGADGKDRLRRPPQDRMP